MTIKVNMRQLEELIQETSRDLKKSTQRGMALAANELRNIAVTNIQGGAPRTGVIRKAGSTTRRSARGEYAKTETGNLVSNIRVNKTGSGYNVTSSAPYSERLEKLARKVLTEPFEENSELLISIINDEVARAF